MDFDNASVVITGGSRGIGLSIAKVFARETNHHLILIARAVDALQSAKKECLELGASGVDILAVDLTDAVSINQIDIKRFNPAILINNAGSFLFKPLENTSSEEFEDQLSINTTSIFNSTKRFLPCLLKHKRALIVNICSQASLKGYAHSGAYTASKHALLGYTRSLRQELLDTTIGVTAINLGQTYSTSWDGVDINPNLLIDPEDVGTLIVAITNLSARSVVEELILMPQKGETKPM